MWTAFGRRQSFVSQSCRTSTRTGTFWASIRAFSSCGVISSTTKGPVQRGAGRATRNSASHSLTVCACSICGKRSEEHTSELQSLAYLVCRLLLEKKKKKKHESVLTD